MVEQVFGITIVGAATSLLPTAGIVFLPFADEPEPVPFSAVWSSFNRELRPNRLEWVTECERHCDERKDCRL